MSRLLSDERIAFARYHEERRSFIFTSNIPGDLQRMWIRASGLPHAHWERRYNYIEVPALACTAEGLEQLVALHNIEIGQREKLVLDGLDKVAGDNYILTAKVSGVIDTFHVNGKPHPFQVVGAELGLRNKQILIGDEPGLGKTIEVALILSRLRKPAIIICPKNAKYVWNRTLLNWIPGVNHFDIAMLAGSKSYRIPDDKRFVIVSYELISWWALQLDTLDRDVFIIDEIHKLGKPNSKRSQAAYFLARNATYRIGTTGTAAQNRPQDIIHPLDVLGVADRLGGAGFLMRRFGKAPKSDSVAEREAYAQSLVTFHTWLRQEGAYVRRTKHSVRLQLPEKRREVVPIQLVNEEEYRKAAESFRAWADRANAIKQGGITAWANLVVAQRLLDLGTDEVPDIGNYKDFPIALQGMARINTLKQLAFLGKLPAIKEWVDDLLDSGQKLILFAWFKESQRILKSMWPEGSTVSILGTDDERQRENAIWRFQNDPNTRLIVCSIKAASEAITLTAASNVAHVEFPWTPTDLQQAEDRAHRIGQTEPVTCWNLVGLDTIEEVVIELLSDKLEELSHLIDGKPAHELPIINPVLSTLLERTRRDRIVQRSPVYTGTFS